eukprot:6070100-Prymnesium_polylepis.1
MARRYSLNALGDARSCPSGAARAKVHSSSIGHRTVTCNLMNCHRFGHRILVSPFRFHKIA